MLNFKDQTFGVELEITHISRDRAAVAIAQVLNGNDHYTKEWSYDRRVVKDSTGRKWTVCSDASVTGSSSNHGGEFVTPVLRYEDIPVLQECIRALRRAGARVNNSCGLHIHVGADKHNAKSLKNLAFTFKAKQDLIYKAAGATDRLDNQYCRPIDDRLINKFKEVKAKDLDMNKVADVWYGTYAPYSSRTQHYNHSRYHGLNFHSVWYHGTVEFRLFHATLHAGEVRAYINLVLAMSAQAINSKRASADVLENGNDKYAMRCWLLRLGFIGDEYKNVRMHLMKRLEGNAAWRNDPATYASYNNRTQATA